ncbi:MAG TPA: OsmC family peroxiredoxin [Candidatus Thermoplasmatota archaeon]|nr:OsmC family peroxiredoxin [Candidatus Thermoplasmatota archaeon]
MVKRTASAAWTGGLKDGKGTVSTERGVLKSTPYNFSGRFEEGTLGTNPEELIAAAHASCFSMASSAELGKAGIVPQAVETTATLSFEKVNEKMTVAAIHLDTVIRAPGADATKVAEAVEAAKAGCPISRLLAPGTKITMSHKLA